MNAKARLEANPYEKAVLLSESECRALLGDATPCAYCGAVDLNKTHENVGQHRWRDAYAPDNAFPLCRLCFKVRRGRTRDELIASSQRIIASLTRRHGSVDDASLVRAVAQVQRSADLGLAHSQSDPRQRDDKRNNTVSESQAIRHRYEKYVRRQSVRPLGTAGQQQCAWGALGDPRRQGGASDEGRRLSFRRFCSLMHERECFYCGAQLTPPGQRGYGRVATLDRVSARGCYSPRNVVVSCGPCNQAKSTLDLAEFVGHMARLAKLG
jgi:hypothetical protein